MPIYLSEYIGSGQPGDLFRPRGSDQPGWAAIDLRADGGATLDGGGLNRCLLYLPTHDPDARLYQLSDQKGERVPLAVRAGLAARLNATLNFTRLDDLIADLLLRPPARAWKPLRDRPTQPLAIYLGGLLSPSPALRTLAAQIYSETWNAADSGSLTADLIWSEAVGAGWQIVSNQARMVGDAGYGLAIAQHDIDTDDQRVTASLVTFTRDATGQTNACLVGRIADADTSTFYQVIASVSPTWSTKSLEKYVSGAGTSLGSASSATFSLPEAMRLTMDGSAISGAIGSTSHGPVTDTSISGQTRAGIVGYSNHASNVIALDNWDLRDVAAIGMVQATGSADGVGAASGAGQATAGGAGSSAGAGTASGAGAAIDGGEGGAAGSGAAPGVTAAIDTADGSAAGVGAAAGAGAALARTDGASVGAGSASGSAVAVSPGAASADGVGVAAGVGAAIDTAVGASDGAGVASGAGQATAGGVGSSMGSATPSGAGAAVDAGTGSIDAGAQAAGQSGMIVSADGAAAGTSAVTGETEVSGLAPVVVLMASARAYRLVARPRGFDRSAQRRRFTVRAIAREYVQHAAPRIYVMQSIHD